MSIVLNVIRWNQLHTSPEKRKIRQRLLNSATVLNSATSSGKRNSRQRCRIPQQLQNSTTLQCTNAFPPLRVTCRKLRIKMCLVPELRKISVFAHTLKRFHIRYHLTSELQTILPKTNEQNPAESPIFLPRGHIVLIK